MNTITKALAVAGVALGGYTAYDKATSGTWWWEKVTTMSTRQNQIQQNMMRLQVQQQVQTQLKAREAQQRKESQVMHGKYTSQAGWIAPNPANYGLNHY